MLQETVWALSNIQRPLRHVSAEVEPGGVLSKKGVPRNFSKFTGKHQCQSFFFNKVEGLFRIPPDDCIQS